MLACSSTEAFAVASYHPQIVHFVIALLVVGVVFRAISLLRKPAFAGPTALVLLGLGTIAAVLAVASVRDAVVEHEEWGERTRNIFLLVMGLEAVGLLMLRSEKSRYVYMASAGVGVVGLLFLYQAGEHGGRIVYSYAGGVGIRSGDPADVERLLLAGLYQQAQVDRRAGRPREAHALMMQAARRHPNDMEVQLAAADSQLIDLKDPQAALGTLRRISPPAENRSLRVRHGIMTANALDAAGQRDGALAVLQGLATEYPDDARVRQRIEQLKSGKPAQ
jgi:uncharacterized membrane protein